MQKVYIVRWGQGSNQPESYVLGLYPTKDLARARIDMLLKNEEFNEDEIWFEGIEVGPQGGDCMLSNR